MMNKEEIRNEILNKRIPLGQKQIDDASALVEKCLFENQTFLKAESVGFYYPFKGEIDTVKMIEKTLLYDKGVYLPKTAENKLVFHKFGNIEELIRGEFGMMEPSGGEIGEPDVLVVPGIAFDMDKYRLGFGKGFYDKYIAVHKTYSIGICYKWQMVEKLPHDAQDQQLDVVIAENIVIE